MPLVNARCTNCKTDVKVDSDYSVATCKYCGLEFRVKKAIKDFDERYINSGASDFLVRGGVLEKYYGSETEVVISDGIVAIESAFIDCKFLKNVKISDSVTIIGDHAFENCISLSNISIPYGVKEIGCFAFAGCISLLNITIPNSVKKIGAQAFVNCTSLKGITISNSVTKISDCAFMGCTSLSNVTISNSVTKISDYAFTGCTSLSNVTIPDSYTNFNFSAFFDTPYYDVICDRRNRNKCQHCGGSFGLFSNKCKNCGREKDY